MIGKESRRGHRQDPEGSGVCSLEGLLADRQTGRQVPILGALHCVPAAARWRIHISYIILCHLTLSYPIVHYPMESFGNPKNFMDYPLGYPTQFCIILYHPELSYRSLWNPMESYGISYERSYGILPSYPIPSYTILDYPISS